MSHTMTALNHLETAKATTEDCRYCWMCRQACPVGHVTDRETLTPHGWALTIASVERGTLQWDEETSDVLYQCADCGMCRAHCVTDRPLPDAIAAARVEIVAAGVAPPIVYEIDEKLRQWANPYAAEAPRPGEASRPAGAPVGLFVGDAAHYLRPHTVEAARALLGAAGVDAVPIGVGRSSGLLASTLGLAETAATLARAVLADIEAVGCRELLVLGPGDRYAFDRLYRDRLQVAWPDGVAVKEVSDVLGDALDRGRVSFRPRGGAPAYAYHDPCHSPRIDRTGTTPRALLTAALGDATARRLFWREGRAHPCGAVGGLELTQPDLAARLAAARFADASAAEVSWLVTEDPLCLHHLGRCQSNGVEVRDLYELLLEQLER